MGSPRSRHWAAALVTLGLACATTHTTSAPTKPAAPAKPAIQVPAIATTASKELTDDEVCQADGYDFAAGSEEYDGRRVLDCGVGPGTPCASDEARCDGTRHLQCYHGRLAMMDCREYCRTGDEMGVTYDHGTCAPQDGSITCTCCDFGEPGCEAATPPPTTKPTPRSPPSGAARSAPR